MITWFSYFIVLLGIAFGLLYKYSTRKQDYWKKRNVYYIKPVPFFGNILPVLSFRTTIGEFFWQLYDQAANEDFFGIFIFNRPALILKSTKLIKSVFQNDFSYFENRSLETNLYDPVMANFLFFMKNPAWKQARAKLSPIFTSGKLKSMFPLILEQGNQMIDYITKFANVPNVESKEICAKYGTNVIARCAFAVDAQSFEDENAEFRIITKEMFGYRTDTAMRQFGSWFTPGLVKLFGINFFHLKLINAFKRIFTDVLHSRQQSSNGTTGHDLIDILIETNRKHGGNYFPKDAMVGHAAQFLAAGFETVSSTLSFALYELAIHPAMQEKLRAEIIEHTKEDGITYNGLQDMKYMDMVICETLRKYPVVPFLDRTCKADYKIDGTDLVIEKGTAVFIPMFGLHYNPKYFPDPHKFDPERFADKSKLNNGELYYMPFGEGPRICIGERFGMLGVKTGLASVLAKFRLEQCEETPVPIKFMPKSLVLQSTVGIPLKFVPL